jgi:DMSO/TMAO reductase YedYZ molybdopterin-dependent catalytic subunit
VRTLIRITLLALFCLPLVSGCIGCSPMPARPATTVPDPASGTLEPSAATEETQPPLTPIDKLGVTGTPIDVDIEWYRLVVGGLVERPLSLSLEDLMAYPTVTQVPRLDCPGFFVDYAEWTGPLVRVILQEAGVKPEATHVVFYDGSEFPYRARLTLEEALREDTFLAYELYGQPLPPEHGYPLRLVAGSKLGSSWVKWLFRIEVE